MLNTSDTFFTTFNEKLTLIDKNTSPEAKKSIHFRSSRNFIFYYGSLKKNKIFTRELLNDYLELIETENFLFDQEQSLEAFNKFIKPLAVKIYTRYFNFSSQFAFQFEFFLFVLPNYILWIFFHSSMMIISVLPLYLVYWVNYVIKYYKHKIYGYRY